MADHDAGISPSALTGRKPGVAVALTLSLLAGSARTPDPLGGSVQGLIASQIIIAFHLGTFILSQPAIRFRIVPRRARHDRAHAEAMRQFQAQGIDKTEHRTGVLIFASAAQRYVEVVADAGINDRVSSDVWDDAVRVLVAAVKEGRPGDGFVAAIERCGAVLAEHFPPGALKRDELPDKLLEI